MNQRPGLPSNLGCLCGTQLDPHIAIQDDQHVSFIIKDGPNSFSMVVAYASTSYIKRRELWSTLADLKFLKDIPWSYIGDFNTILGAHEHRGS